MITIAKAKVANLLANKGEFWLWNPIILPTFCSYAPCLNFGASERRSGAFRLTLTPAHCRYWLSIVHRWKACHPAELMRHYQSISVTVQDVTAAAANTNLKFKFIYLTSFIWPTVWSCLLPCYCNKMHLAISQTGRFIIILIIFGRSNFKTYLNTTIIRGRYILSARFNK